MSSINDRVSQVIKFLGVTQSAFAKSLDTSTSRVTNITQGRNKPDSQFLAKLAEEYPQVDMTWLLTGKGQINRNVVFPGTILSTNLVIPGTENPYSDPYLKPSLDPSFHRSLQEDVGNSTMNQPVLKDENRQNNSFKIITTQEEALAAAAADTAALFASAGGAQNLQAMLNNQRIRFSKFLWFLNKQHPDLFKHQQQLEKLAWLMRDAHESVDEHLSPVKPEALFTLDGQRVTEKQSFEQYQTKAIEKLEHSLSLTKAATELIEVLERFLQAMPPSNLFKADEPAA